MDTSRKNAYPLITPLRQSARFLAQWEIWPVALLVGAGMLSERLLPLAVGVALLFWPVRWLAYGRLSVRTPADGAVLILALMVPVTLWATALPEKTDPQVFRLLSGLALYYALANWAVTRSRLRWVVLGVVLAGLLLALAAPVSVEWAAGKLPFIPASLYERFTLLVSDTVHPNVLAGSLVILLPVVLAVLLFAWRRTGWPERLLAGIASLGMLGVIVLTQSRGSWMALALVLVLLVTLRWRWGWLALPLAAVAAGVLLYALGVTRALDLLATSSTVGGIEGRVEIWSRAIYMVQDFSFTGIGMGSFGDVADVLYPFFLASPGTIPHAHNLFLQVAVDLGVPGLVAWLAALLAVLAASWQVYRYGCAPAARDAAWQEWAAGLGAGLLCSQVALAVHGLTDAVTWGMVRPAPFVWALWGLAVAALNLVVEPGGLGRARQ